MKNLNKYIIEKFKINSKNIKREFQFDLEGFKEKIKLPFKIKIVDTGDLQEVYTIDNPFSKEHNEEVFRLFDKDDKVITYFEEDKALKLFKDKQEIYVCIYYLDGLSVYKYYKIKLEE